MAETLRATLSALPRAERAVAGALLADYPVAGLQTVARLAAQAGVSGPTVLRLTERLGFAAYADFQEELRHELQERLRSPLDQLAAQEGQSDPVRRARHRFEQNLARTFDLLDLAECERAVDLLSAVRRRVFSTGGRFTALPARSLALHLEIVRPGVRYLSVEDRTALLLELVPQDVLVAIDLRRYQASTIAFGRAAVARGARLVLITDAWHSPLASDAEVVLPCALDSPSAFDSLVGANLVVETLLGGVLEHLGETARPRMHAYDDAWAAADFPETTATRPDQPKEER